MASNGGVYRLSEDGSWYRETEDGSLEYYLGTVYVETPPWELEQERLVVYVEKLEAELNRAREKLGEIQFRGASSPDHDKVYEGFKPGWGDAWEGASADAS